MHAALNTNVCVNNLIWILMIPWIQYENLTIMRLVLVSYYIVNFIHLWLNLFILLVILFDIFFVIFVNSKFCSLLNLWSFKSYVQSKSVGHASTFKMHCDDCHTNFTFWNFNSWICFTNQILSNIFHDRSRLKSEIFIEYKILTLLDEKTYHSVFQKEIWYFDLISH